MPWKNSESTNELSQNCHPDSAKAVVADEGSDPSKGEILRYAQSEGLCEKDIQSSKIVSKLTEQIASSQSADQPDSDIVQLWLAQCPQNIQYGKEDIAKVVEPKAGYEPAQVVVDLKAGSLPPTAGQIHKPATDAIILLDDSPIDFKSVSPDTSGQVTAAGVQFEEGQDTNRIYTSNSMFLASGGNDSRHTSNELTYGVLADADSKIAAAGGETTTGCSLDTLCSQKTSISISKETGLEALINGGNKVILPTETQITQDESAISDHQRMLLSDVNLPAVQGELALFQQEIQEISAGLGKSTNVAEKPTVTKATFFQQTRWDVPGLSESLGSGSKGQDLNSSDNPTIQKLNTKAVQMPDSQMKDISNLAANSGSNSNFECIFAPNPPSIDQPSISEQSSVLPDAGKDPNNMLPSGTSASISQQILESIQKSPYQEAGRQQITVHLNPPELGRVCIQFQEHQDKIIGILKVDKAQTKQEIEQLLPQLARDLQDCGIQIKRLDVILTSQIEQQDFKDPFLQDGLLQQHSFTASDDSNNSDTSGTGESLQYDINYDNSEPQVQISDNYINMLI